MGLIFKLAALVFMVLIVVVVAGGLYVATLAGAEIPGVSGVFKSEGQPPSPEVVARGREVERKIEAAVSDTSAYYLELTDEELTALLMSKIDASTGVRDAAVSIHPATVDISGHLNGRPAVPFSGSVVVTLDQGEIDVDLKDVSLGLLPVPGAVRQELQPLIDQALDLNRSLQSAGSIQVQQLSLQEGKVTIVGVQPGGKTVSDTTREALLNAVASSSSRPAPVPPGAEVVPPGTVISKPGAELYLALGDSLAANIGAPTPQHGYVSRFHAFLERETGRSLGLMDLGVSGESSISIVRGQLPQALEEISRRKNDGDPGTKVSVLTLDLGANDLLVHLGSAECQNDPRGTACQTRISVALETFAPNFASIAGQLSAALEPDAEFYIVTMYNPFDFGIGIPFESFSNEIVEQLNGIITETAQSVGATVADPYPVMARNAAAWTHMLAGDIHPNADGYQAMAFALAQARER